MKRSLRVFALVFNLSLQATFDAGLQVFEQEGIANITSLKDQLVASGHAQRDAIQKRHDVLMEK